MINRFRRCLSPGERAVIPDKDSGIRKRVADADRLGDNFSCIQFIGGFDLFSRQFARTGNIAVKVIGVRRPKGGDRKSGLRESGRGLRMRMRDPADCREPSIELQVCRSIGGRLESEVEIGRASCRERV